MSTTERKEGPPAQADLQKRLTELSAEQTEILADLADAKALRAELGAKRFRQGGRLNDQDLAALLEAKDEIKRLGADHQDLLQEAKTLRRSMGESDSALMKQAMKDVLTGLQFGQVMDRYHELVGGEL